MSRREDIEISKPKSILRFIYRDFYRFNKMKTTFEELLDTGHPIKFITPSAWMLKEAEQTMNVKLSSLTQKIPNGIDTGLFSFNDLLWKNRHKILTIRPLILKGKYGVDLALDTIRLMGDEFKLSLYGSGNDEQKIKRYARNISSEFEIFPYFLNRGDIPNIHKNHGIYYGVTRMDAQGVSMCEAMSSGLPVVSFNVCAVSEFVKDHETGVLIEPYDLRTAADRILELTEDRNLFEKLSRNARIFTESIDINRTAIQEIELAQSLI